MLKNQKNNIGDKIMKFLAKSISLMLICVMLISSLASCMNPTVNNTTQDQSEAQSESQTQSESQPQSDTAEPNTEDPDDKEEATDPDETEDLDSDADINEDETQNENDEDDEDISDSEEDTNATIPDESEEPDTSETDTPTVTPQDFPKNSFPILQSKKYVIKVTTSDLPTSIERLVASNLRRELKSATSVSISATTDYEKEDKNAYEILIGKTSRTESTAVYNSVPYGAYGVKIVGNKIVFYFSTEAEGSSLVTQFAKKIQSNDAGQFWVTNTLSIVNISSPTLTGLPKYPADSTKTTNTGDNTQMVTVTNTTLNKFNEYCNTLKNNQYVEYSKRDVDGNYFRIYTKGATAVNAYFSSGRKEARIIAGPLKDIPSKDVDKTPETIKPSITMIGPSESTGNGLGLVYQLANGKFLIIDGGHILSDRIYKELRELQPNGGKLIVAGWFISHPHNDHQDSIENFITYHANEVEIENIYFNYANPDYYNNLSSKYHQGEDQKEGARVTRLRELLAKKLSLSTNIIKPHTGQIYTFGSAKVEIISTVEDFLPTKLTHVNDASMVIRVTVAGQSTMILADAADGMKDIISAMYKNSLKSDMVTLAHHGTWDTRPALYNKIQGKVLFWPSNTAGAKEFYGKGNSTEGKQAILAALSNATDVFLAKGTDTKLMLPYTPVGNKQAFINSIK